MRMLLQRVTSASVTVDGEVTGEIGEGLLLLLGIGAGDSEDHAVYLLEKTLNLRVFEDTQGKMNRTVQEIGGGLLIVSQFTLYADIRRGRRPGFDQAAPPEKARKLYDYFVNSAKTRMANIQTGLFQAHMTVKLVNDGPVTIFHDSIDKFGNKSHAVR
ncbi:MAG: D-aminoacyl-tRNA deacylase [Bryobacteraceae bacterium]